MKLIVLLLLAALSMNSAPVQPNMRDVDEVVGSFESDTNIEPYWDYFGSYGRSCRLVPLPEIDFPEGRFRVYTFRRKMYASVACLQPRHILESDYPPGKALAELKRPFPAPLESQTSFFKKDGELTRLTLGEASRLWGQPRTGDGYYSFDARNFHHGEPNLFHLDFAFGADGFVSSYRVRGIGIIDSGWVIGEKSFPPGENQVHFGDLPPKDPEHLSLRPGPNVLKRLPMRYGGKKAGLFLCTENGQGWLITASGKPFMPSLSSLTKLWGVPRLSKAKFYTFDLSCKQADGEPDIYHVDVKCDEKSNVIDHRLRGPGLGLSAWNSARTNNSAH